MKNKNYAYITLTDNNYIIGTEVLIRSLKKVNNEYSLIIMYVNLKKANLLKLKKYKNIILKKVKKIENPFFEKEKMQKYLKYVYTKLNCFNFNEYSKMIFLDSDILVLKNIDNLFFKKGNFIGCYDEFLKLTKNLNFFYSGFFIYEPSKRIFKDILKKIKKIKSFDNGDMGFLNIYFKDEFTPLNKNYHRIKELLYYKKDFSINKLSLLHYTGVKPWIIKKNIFENLCFDKNLNVLWNKYYKEKNFVNLRKQYFKKKYGLLLNFILYNKISHLFFRNYKVLRFIKNKSLNLICSLQKK